MNDDYSPDMELDPRSEQTDDTRADHLALRIINAYLHSRSTHVPELRITGRYLEKNYDDKPCLCVCFRGNDHEAYSVIIRLEEAALSFREWLLRRLAAPDVAKWILEYHDPECLIDATDTSSEKMAA